MLMLGGKPGGGGGGRWGLGAAGIDRCITKDIYVCGTYIPPYHSRYFRPELFEELQSDIDKFSSLGPILIMGDFNSRVGKHPDRVCQERNKIITNDFSESSLYAPPNEKVLTMI